MQENLKVSNKV